MKDFKVKYIGETCRSGYERGCEHQDVFRYTREKSHLFKHHLISHPGTPLEDLKFGMRIIRRCRTALECQVGKAVCIDNARRKGYHLLNSKSEYSGCSLLCLMMGNPKDIVENIKGKKIEEKNINDKIRQLKKRPKEKRKDALEDTCLEIIEENRNNWKKRKILRGEEKRLQKERDRGNGRSFTV